MPTFKELTDFFREVGADDVEHTEKTYLAHAIGVYNDLKSWGGDEELCRAALYHSIYGTELFQGFTLPIERRGEVRALIGERAERLAYINCAMERASFDQAVEHGEPPYAVTDRLTGETIEMSREDFDDLCRIHLCDWVEQVGRSNAWTYRQHAYQNLAERLGGIAKSEFERAYATKL